jgi:hypothetical protein
VLRETVNMKKTNEKKLTVARDTLKALQHRQLGVVVGGSLINTCDVCQKAGGPTVIPCCSFTGH